MADIYIPGRLRKGQVDAELAIGAEISLVPPDGHGNLTTAVTNVQVLMDEVNTLTISGGGGGGGVSTFLALNDTPRAYTGQTGKVLRVNSGANGLEFADAAEFDGNLTGSLRQTGDRITLNHGATGNLNQIGYIDFVNGYRDTNGNPQTGQLVYSATRGGELSIRNRDGLTHLLHGRSEISAYPDAITNRWVPAYSSSNDDQVLKVVNGALEWSAGGEFPGTNINNLAGNLRFYIQDPDGFPTNDGTPRSGYLSMTQVRNNISIEGYQTDATAMDRDDRLRVFQTTNARSSAISNVLELAQWDDMTDVTDISSGAPGQFPVINLAGNQLEWGTPASQTPLSAAAEEYLSHTRLSRHTQNNTSYQPTFTAAVQYSITDLVNRTGGFATGSDITGTDQQGLALNITYSGAVLTGLPSADTFDASALTMYAIRLHAAPGSNQILTELHHRGNTRGTGNSQASVNLMTDPNGYLSIQRPGSGTTIAAGQYRRMHAVTNTDVFFNDLGAGDIIVLNPLPFGVGMGFEVWVYDADAGPRDNPGELYQCNDVEFSTAIRTQFERDNNLGGGFSSAEELQARNVFSTNRIELHSSSKTDRLYGFRHTEYESHSRVANLIRNHLDDTFLYIKHVAQTSWVNPGFDGNQDITGNVNINGTLVVGGNLTVNGTTTTINSTTKNIGDRIITLNANETGTPTQNGGIEIERGTADNAQLVWDEQNDEWQAGAGTLSALLTGLSTPAQFSPSLQSRLVPNTGTGVLRATADNVFAFGTVGVDDIPNLPATKITTETFDENRIPEISLEKIHNYPRIAQPIETGDAILDVTAGSASFTVYYTDVDWPTNWTTAGDGNIMYNFELQTTGANIHLAINKTLSSRYFHVVPNNTEASLPNNSSLTQLDLADFWMHVNGPEDANGFYITQIGGKIAYLLEASHQAGAQLRIYPMQLEDSAEPVIANRVLLDIDPIPGSRPTISRALITDLDFPSVRDNEFYNFEIRTTRGGTSVFLNRDSFINKTITGRYLKGIVDTATGSDGRRPANERQSWVELRGPGTNAVLFGRKDGKLVINDHSTSKFDADGEISFYEMHVRRGTNDNFAAVKSGPPIVHFAYETNDTTVRHTDIPFPVFNDNQMYQAEFWGPNTETRINKTFSGRYINALTTASTAAVGAATFTGGQYVMMELPGDDTLEIGYNAAGNIVYRSQQNNLMGHFFQIRPIVAEVAGTTLVTEDVDTVETLSDAHEVLVLDESGVPEKISVADARSALAGSTNLPTLTGAAAQQSKIVGTNAGGTQYELQDAPSGGGAFRISREVVPTTYNGLDTSINVSSVFFTIDRLERFERNAYNSPNITINDAAVSTNVFHARFSSSRPSVSTANNLFTYAQFVSASINDVLATTTANEIVLSIIKTGTNTLGIKVVNNGNILTNSGISITASESSSMVGNNVNILIDMRPRTESLNFMRDLGANLLASGDTQYNLEVRDIDGRTVAEMFFYDSEIKALTAITANVEISTLTSSNSKSKSYAFGSGSSGNFGDIYVGRTSTNDILCALSNSLFRRETAAITYHLEKLVIS